VRLTEALGEARQNEKNVVLIFMDLDHFKVVNDGHGHLAGSQVLREVGFLLKRIVGGDASTVARYGGDEFVIILPDTEVDAAASICEEIRQTIAANVFLEREWSFSMPPLCLSGILAVSIGMAQYTPDPASTRSIEQEKNELLRRADAAMYRAKSLGGNRVVVSGASETVGQVL
jgi:diguanylate cyclase (GGDEF)-like protein